MKFFGGKVLFLDKSDINTDELIPARYLTEITKEALKPYLLEDLELDNFNPLKDIKGKTAIITRDNFGCGSSREHAPWALEINNINVVIAQGYSRIFRQNMFNCGMLAITLDDDKIDNIFNTFSNIEATLNIDLDNGKLIISSKNKSLDYNFEISGFDKDLVVAGGWLNYADSNY